MRADANKPLNMWVALSEASAADNDVAGLDLLGKVRVYSGHQIRAQDSRIGLAFQRKFEWHHIAVDANVIAEFPASAAHGQVHHLASCVINQ